MTADDEPVASVGAAYGDGGIEGGGEGRGGECFPYRTGYEGFPGAEQEDVGEERHDLLDVMGD